MWAVFLQAQLQAKPTSATGQEARFSAMPCPIKTAAIAVIAVLALIFQMDYNGWASSLSEAKDKTATRKLLYYVTMALLLLFHVELFSGGAFCRLVFARSKYAMATDSITSSFAL